MLYVMLSLWVNGLLGYLIMVCAVNAFALPDATVVGCVLRYFSRGGDVDILLILFRFLTIQFN